MQPPPDGGLSGTSKMRAGPARLIRSVSQTRRVAPGRPRPVDRYILTAMPTILRAGPYRLFFYSADRGEAPHVHVEREAKRVRSGWIRSDSTRAGGSIGLRLPG